MINTLVFISFAIILDTVANFIKMKEIGLQNGTESFIGSVLVLWVAIEVTDTEINYLEGKRVSISFFPWHCTRINNNNKQKL